MNLIRHFHNRILYGRTSLFTPVSSSMNKCAQHCALFVISAAKALCLPFACNHHRQISCADGKVATLVYLAHLYQMSLRDGRMANNKCSVNLVQLVAAWVALAFERAARRAARNCRGQLFAQTCQWFGLCHLVTWRPLFWSLKAGRHGASCRRHHRAASASCSLG